MKRLQVLIPDETFARLQKEAKRREWTVADLVRRGIDRQLDSAVDTPPWSPIPPQIDLGEILVPLSEWREIANERSGP
jgi:hypothetical protein